MEKVTRKGYAADFKAKVALASIKGEQTLCEQASAWNPGMAWQINLLWRRSA
jgi:hypothetical protein